MENFWPAVLEMIKKDIRPDSYCRWFETIVSVEEKEDKIYLVVSDKDAQSYIEQTFKQMIEAAFSAVSGQNYQVFILSIDEEIPEESSPSNSALARFNPNYTFDTFVVGNFNRFAHAAAMAVSERPVRTYNPLFLYGDSGLGKTHLMHAIAQSFLSKNLDANVVYVSTESFVNEFIYMVRTQQAHAFKNHYRNADIFLIDDIQFLTGKKESQEEFFHTFNTLYESGKQIIISSDRPPKELENLEERLRSRFAWGLITDIQPPEFETRCAILQQKALRDCADIPDDVIFFIAEKISSNIRDLEGALNKVIYYSLLYNIKNLTVDDAVSALKGILPDNELLSIEYIQRTVCEYFGISFSDLLGKKRDRHIAYPRQIAMYLCRSLLDESLPKIGSNFGNRDHTTVIYACDKIEDAKKTDKQLKTQIDSILNKLQH